MILSPLGEIVQEEWQKSFIIRTELFCDAWIIMPNHLHAIVRIDSPVPGNVETNGHVETHGRASLQQSESPTNPGVAYRPPKSIS